MKVYKLYSIDSDNYNNHCLLRSLFPKGKLLFHNHGNMLTINSEFSNEVDNDNLEYVGETRSYNVGDELMFIIRLNGVKSLTGKRVALHKYDIESWVNDKLSNGFTVLSRDVIDEGTVESKRKGGKCWHASLLVRGMLRVDDNHEMNITISNGIGHGKAFGFGMLLCG